LCFSFTLKVSWYTVTPGKGALDFVACLLLQADAEHISGDSTLTVLPAGARGLFMAAVGETKTISSS